MKPTVLAFLLLAILAGCKKNDTSDPSSGLPDTSSSGKNILACRVNGQIHVYSGKASINNDNGVDYTLEKNNYVLLHADNSRYKDAIYIKLECPDSVIVNHIYAFSSENNYEALYFKDDTISYKYKAMLGSGWVQFSRVDRNVAAGTFEFTAYLQDQAYEDSVHITEGRFDISQHSETP